MDPKENFQHQKKKEKKNPERVHKVISSWTFLKGYWIILQAWFTYIIVDVLIYVGKTKKQGIEERCKSIINKGRHGNAPAGCWEELAPERHEMCIQKSFPEHLEDMHQNKMTNEDYRQLTESNAPLRLHLQWKQKLPHNSFLQCWNSWHLKMNFF